MSAATVPMHIERAETGILVPLVLAALVHLLLCAVLFFGVRWQSRPPEPVSVELWVPPQVVERPAPKVEAKIEPKVEPRVEPKIEPPAPKPEPKVQPPKPDIAVVEKPKPEPKPKPKPVPKVEAPKPAPPKPRDEQVQKNLHEDLARAQTQLKLDQEKELVKLLVTRDQAAARQKLLAGYTDKIKAKIKGNIALPQDIKGNPEAVFEVVQLPTGEVLTARLKKSSGHRAYDEAVERAILKSSPLPKPDQMELFDRVLDLRFRPLD